MKTEDLPHRQACREWSNRILIISLLGIAYLTLFPFRLSFAITTVFHRYPFLLGMTGKRPSDMDVFLNVLLFVPFGFGLSAKLRQRQSRRWTSFFLALAIGAGVSYAVEFLQFYIPERDSGWDDVITNAAGSVVGFFLFELWGGPLLEGLSRWEDLFDRWLSPRRAAFMLAAYFAVWFGISMYLQTKTRIIDWDPQYHLFVGNDASGQNPWNGQVFLLQFWNRALPEQTIRQMAARQSAENGNAGLLGSYDLTGSPPYQDQTNVLPPLAWTPDQPQLTVARALDLRPSLHTQFPAETLPREIEKTGRFTIHVVCAPRATAEIGRIVSQSKTAEIANFHLWQEGENLWFWFRNPLSETRSSLAWAVPGVFEGGKVRDIFASYDGSEAFIYLDGNRVPGTYRLNSGAGLMHVHLTLKTADLEAYAVVYETLVFLPGGLLVGVALRKTSGRRISSGWMLVFGGVLPAVLFEILLALVSGRRIWPMPIALSLVFGAAGILLMNADRRFRGCPRTSGEFE
jgi:VanZ family protein